MNEPHKMVPYRPMSIYAFHKRTGLKVQCSRDEKRPASVFVGLVKQVMNSTGQVKERLVNGPLRELHVSAFDLEYHL
jgi:hypothetical protein